MKRLSLQIAYVLFISLVVYAGLSLSSGICYADEPFVTLEAELSVDFLPEETFFFVDFGDSGVERIRGVSLPPASALSSGGRARGGLMVGTRIKVPDGIHQFSYSVLAIGKGNKTFFQPPKMRDLLEGNGSPPSSTDKLRSLIEDRRQMLKSWNVQVKMQEDALQRLRSEVDLIADIGRIVSVREQVMKTREAYDSLVSEQATLESALESIRARPAPKNFNRREVQLTKSIADLADSAKKSESQEGSRKSDSQVRLQRKLAIIESTRNEDLEDLKRKLEGLKKHRMELEAKR